MDPMEKQRWWQPLKYLFMILFSLAILVGGVRWFKDRREPVHTETCTVFSVDLQSRTEGKFFLGQGNLKQADYYIAYEQTEDGGFILVKYPCEYTVLYTTLATDATAYIEKDVNGFGSIKAYRLYVPKNAVIQSYDLNL